MARLTDPWPQATADLVRLQSRLGREVEDLGDEDRWRPTPDGSVGGCFVAFARGEAGPGHPGDRAWAAAATWRPGPGPEGDVVTGSVVAERVPASYAPGLLALREGPILAAAVDALDPAPEVLLVDATGLDHPRGAGLAVHLGAALDIPTVGVTHRGLQARVVPPPLDRRGEASTVVVEGRPTAAWLCTRSGARPLLIHPAWRTNLDTAVEVVLSATTAAARTPAPLRAARHLARSARSAAGAG